MGIRILFIILALLISFSVQSQSRESDPESDKSVSAQIGLCRADVILFAKKLLGTPYRFASSNPLKGFDCSGFVSHVFREGLGLILPRSSKEMSKSGQEIGREELRPGDLVFFNTMRRTFSHVGIYLGDNQFVHAPRTGARVRIEDLRDGYWMKRFNGGRRINPD